MNGKKKLSKKRKAGKNRKKSFKPEIKIFKIDPKLCLISKMIPNYASLSSKALNYRDTGKKRKKYI
jgi:hypothetical protein